VSPKDAQALARKVYASTPGESALTLGGDLAKLATAGVPAELSESWYELALRRHLAILAQVGQQEAKKAPNELAAEATHWVMFLVQDESSSRSFFLQEYRANDNHLYGDSLRPCRRDHMASYWASNKNVLRWLKHPERLTITELELALAIFDWHEEKPRLVWWVKKRPYILWRVHRFLLKRYCLQLLRPLRRARKDAEKNAPPYRAGEQLWAHPRMLGMTMIGMLGCLGVDAFKVIFFASAWWQQAVALAAAFLVLWYFYYVDVYKQNKGVMATKTHGLRRTAWVVARALVVSGVLGLIPLAFWSCFPRERLLEVVQAAPQEFFVPPPAEIVIPLAVPALRPDWPLTASATLGWLCLVVYAALFGCILQWLWEDTSALEPV